MERMLEAAARLLWGAPTAGLILLCGIIFSVKGKFFQLTGFRKCIKETIGSAGRNTRGGVSPLQTACAALGGTLGTGNIVGVCSAIAVGGAGAIFWMWAAAVLGMATACAENVLGMKYRRRADDGSWQGGAMYYIEGGLKCPAAARLYALLTVLSAFCIGSVTQVNSIAAAAHSSFGVPKLAAGAVIAAAAAPAVLGGTKGAVRMAEKLVPFMAGMYILACSAVIIRNARNLPQAVAGIFSGAFTPSAAGGGALGVILTGVRRGVFTNEAGLGTSVAVHCAADGATAAKQGRWAMFEVFFDTVVVCTLTAFALLTGSPDGNSLTEAFSCVLGGFSGAFITLSLLLFAFATVIAWSVYGERAFTYLLGGKSGKIFRWSFLAVLIPGAMLNTGTVWAAADCVNALLAAINGVCLLLLSKEAVSEIRRF